MNKPKIDRDGRSALHCAVVDGQIEQVRSLLANGADVNAHDKAGWTPLHFAVQRHGLEIAALLVEHKADVEAQDAHGNTPLSNAVFDSRGRGAMIELLRRAGADPKSEPSRSFAIEFSALNWQL